MMDKMFRNVKKNMNETVLKDITFNQKNKEKVMQTIYYKRKKHRMFLKPSLSSILSLSVACLFFFGSLYFISERLDIFSREGQVADLNGTKEKNPIGKSSLTPPKDDESKRDLTKEEVVAKLLNTVDNFDTAEGEFESFSIYPDGSTIVTTTEFIVSTNNNFRGFERTTEKLSEGGTSSNEVIYNGKKIWRKESMGKSYTSCDYQPIQSTETYTTPEEAFSVPLEDLYKPNTKLRERPLISSDASRTLFPYENASSFLKDTNNWKIEKQNEEISGHNTIVLYGQFTQEVKDWLKDEAFRFWVDKDTGILVKYEIYDKDGVVTSYLHPTRLEVNVPVDEAAFIPNLDGYNEVKNSCLRKTAFKVLTDEGKEEEAKELEIMVLEDTKNNPDIVQFTVPG
jgi:outer membrane lipoprotein-sorting protein